MILWVGGSRAEVYTGYPFNAPSGRSLYFDMPTVAIESQQHRIGMVLIGSQKFRVFLPGLLPS